MSTRAVRKVQRLREEEKEERVRRQTRDEDEPEEPLVEEVESPQRNKPNLFALLNEIDDNGNDESGSDEALAPEQNHDLAVASKAKSKHRKKKKKKQKKREDESVTSHSPATLGPSQRDDGLDEIDLALRSLNLATSGPEGPNNTIDSHAPPAYVDDALERLSALLSIDLLHLNVTNEMRRLFGRVIDEADDGEGPPQAAGRRARRAPNMPPQARHKNLLASLARRNIFVTPLPTWPSPTPGPTMTMLATEDDGFTEYRISHPPPYQSVQSQYLSCVESLDPQRLLVLLHHNPYHISTLLQVSQIALHDRDAATASDFLARSLFAFGRAVHSTFPSRLARAKAGLDFRRPENREFFLAAVRYIANLAQRGTHRTALEWAKCVLSLDPETDPYRIRLSIDQLALRARQPQFLIDLHASKLHTDDPASCPNLSFSLALAYLAIDRTGDEARRALFQSLTRYPFVFARLYRELGLEPAPSSIAGMQPRTDRETLFTEIYAIRAKDLWSTPEATALLQEVAGISEKPLEAGPVDLEPISAEEARCVFLMDVPALIGLLPRALTARAGTVSDPVPPTDSLPWYTLQDGHDVRGGEEPEAASEREFEQDPEGLIARVNADSGGIRAIIARLLPRLNIWGGDGDTAEGRDTDMTEEQGTRDETTEMSAEELLEALQEALDREEVGEEAVERALSEREGEVNRRFDRGQEALEERSLRREGEMRALGLRAGDEDTQDDEHEVREREERGDPT